MAGPTPPFIEEEDELLEGTFGLCLVFFMTWHEWCKVARNVVFQGARGSPLAPIAQRPLGPPGRRQQGRPTWSGLPSVFLAGCCKNLDLGLPQHSALALPAADLRGRGTCGTCPHRCCAPRRAANVTGPRDAAMSRDLLPRPPSGF